MEHTAAEEPETNVKELNEEKKRETNQQLFICALIFIAIVFLVVLPMIFYSR